LRNSAASDFQTTRSYIQWIYVYITYNIITIIKARGRIEFYPTRNNKIYKSMPEVSATVCVCVCVCDMMYYIILRYCSTFSMDLNPTPVTTIGLRIYIMRQARPPRLCAKIISMKLEDYMMRTILFCFCLIV